MMDLPSSGCFIRKLPSCCFCGAHTGNIFQFVVYDPICTVLIFEASFGRLFLMYSTTFAFPSKWYTKVYFPLLHLLTSASDEKTKCSSVDKTEESEAAYAALSPWATSRSWAYWLMVIPLAAALDPFSGFLKPAQKSVTTNMAFAPLKAKISDGLSSKSA